MDVRNTSKTSPPAPKRLHRPAWERRLPCEFKILATLSDNSLTINVELESTDSGVKHRTYALVDCGTTALFINKDYVRKNEIPTQKLIEAIPVFNVDGTLNVAGMICEVAEVILQYNDHSERAVFAVMKPGGYTMILGYTWLCKHNPQIDWQSKQITMSRCLQHCLTC